MLLNGALGANRAFIDLLFGIYLRLMRSQVMAIRETRYVEASLVAGFSDLRTIARHVLPNAMGPALAQLSVNVCWSILLTAGLSFIGAGVRAPTPEWGAMVSEGTQYFQQWWIGTFPGLAIFTVVLSLNFLGDSLRDALDPHSSWTTRGRGRGGAA